MGKKRKKTKTSDKMPKATWFLIRCQKDYVSFTYPFKSHDSHRGFNLKLPALWPCQGTTVIFSIPRSTKTFLIACQHDAPPQLIPKVCHRVCEAHTRLGKIPPQKKKITKSCLLHVSFAIHLSTFCCWQGLPPKRGPCFYFWSPSAPLVSVSLPS